MSLIIRRNANSTTTGIARDGVVIDGGWLTVRVIKVDSDGTVHLAFKADREVSILREELVDRTSTRRVFRYQRGDKA